MKTTLQDISPVKKKLDIEIEPKEVDKKINEAYRELGKGIKMPGFRAGKVPRKILERRFGSQVMEDVTRRLVSETLAKAVEETNTHPLSMPVIENEVLKSGQGFRYSAVMEVRPEFELKDYIGLEVNKEICSVTEEDVDSQLEEVRKTHGELKPIGVERGAKSEDYVILEYEGFEDGRAVEGAKDNNFLLKIGSNDFHPEFEKGLIGRKKGERSEVKVKFEENDSRSSLAGKTVDFKVKLIDIKEMILPELNDAFATGLGADFKNLEDLRKAIKDGLVAREEKRIDRELKMRLLGRITDSVAFELPESLVDGELNAAVENIRQNLIRSGSSMEKAGLSEEKLRKELRPASEKRVKQMLVLAEIARKEGMSVNEMELSEGFKAMAVGTGQDPTALRKYYEANHLIDSFRQTLLEEKTLNYLVKGANISEVEADKLSSDKLEET